MRAVSLLLARLCVCERFCFSLSVETLADTVKKTLHYCRNMCEGLELGQPHARTLLKMMVINIFSIHHAAESCGGKPGGGFPSVMSW